MKTILIAEPDAAVRELLCLVVARLGHEPVQILERGEADATGLAAALVEPSWAFGLAFVERLRAQRPELPVLCVSIRPPTAELRAFARGAYLEKPFALAELRGAVESALAS
jgi:CheY-like chemotaxis protein